MSTDASSGQPIKPTYDDPTRARHIRRAYNQQDREHPPTQRETARLNGCIRDRYLGGEGDWDDALRTAGVPGVDDIVAEAVREQFEDRHPWQNFIRVAARDLDELPEATRHVAGLRLKQIANGERHPDAMDGLRLEFASGGSAPTIWEVHPDE